MDNELLRTLINVVQILLAIVLTGVILLQVKGQGGGLFGGSDGTYRTRRGVEKTLFQFTVVLIGVFIITSIISVRVFAG